MMHPGRTRYNKTLGKTLPKEMHFKDPSEEPRSHESVRFRNAITRRPPSQASPEKHSGGDCTQGEFAELDERPQKALRPRMVSLPSSWKAASTTPYRRRGGDVLGRVNIASQTRFSSSNGKAAANDQPQL